MRWALGLGFRGGGQGPPGRGADLPAPPHRCCSVGEAPADGPGRKERLPPPSLGRLTPRRPPHRLPRGAELYRASGDYRLQPVCHSVLQEGLQEPGVLQDHPLRWVFPTTSGTRRLVTLSGERGEAPPTPPDPLQCQFPVPVGGQGGRSFCRPSMRKGSEALFTHSTIFMEYLPATHWPSGHRENQGADPSTKGELHPLRQIPGPHR